MTEQSEGYRERVIARAQGDAARFSQLVAEVREAPEITRDRLYFDVMTEVLSTTSTVLVDMDGSGSVMMLPIEQMLKRMQQSGGKNGSGSNSGGAILGGGSGNTSTLPDPRSRSRGTR